MKFTPEELAKLPRWASSKIFILEQALAVSEAHVERLNGKEPTTVFQQYRYKETEVTQYLNEDYDVTFALDKPKGDRQHRFQIRKARGSDLNYYGPHLVVYEEGGHGIQIEPQVTNVIRLYVRH